MEGCEKGGREGGSGGLVRRERKGLTMNDLRNGLVNTHVYYEYSTSLPILETACLSVRGICNFVVPEAIQTRWDIMGIGSFDMHATIVVMQ